MTPWQTQHYAESRGVTVDTFLRLRLRQGCTYGEIAREVGVRDRKTIRRLAIRHGMAHLRKGGEA